jgi:hypothetical protein
VAEIALGVLDLLEAGIGHVFRVLLGALGRHLAGPPAKDDWLLLLVHARLRLKDV